jgi:ABC-type multidrug transport system ATPase subunit
MNALLEVVDLRKTYGPHTALDGVTFGLDAGEIAVLAGSNGAGKSTLLRCLAGLAACTGTAHLLGRPLTIDPEARRRLGYVPQSVALPESSTVAEVLHLFARLRGSELTALDLPDGFLPDGQRRVGTLSGGQQQRVVVAAALLGDPALLLLDEPAANLDVDGRGDLWGLLHERSSAGTAVLLASPSPRDLAGVADRMITLDQGRIRHDDRLVARHRRAQMLLRPSTSDDAREVGA